MWMHVCTVYVAKGLRALTTVTHKNLGEKKKQSVPFCSSVVLYKYFSGRQINILSAVTTLQHADERKRHLSRAQLVLSSVETTKEGERKGTRRPIPSLTWKRRPSKVTVVSFFFLFDRSGIDIWQICILIERKMNNGRNRAFDSALLSFAHLSNTWAFLYLCCF